MAGYKNSPTGVLNDDKGRVSVSRHWHDLSHKRITSLPFAKVVPILCEFLQGNTKVKLDTKYALQTNPTVSPVFSRVDLTTTAILCPIRLYVHGLYGNNYEEVDLIDNIPLPGFDATEIPASEGYAVCIGSLLHRLRYPAFQCLERPLTGNAEVYPIVANGDVNRLLEHQTTFIRYDGSIWDNFNSLAVLAYYDACRYYYADAYDRSLPFEFTEFDLRGEVVTRYEYFVDCDELVHSIYNFRFSAGPALYLQSPLPVVDYVQDNEYFETSFPILLSAVDDNLDTATGPIRYLDNVTVHDGLFPCTYKPDYTNAFYDIDEVEKLVVTTAGNIQSVRLAQADFNLKASILTRGKRYTDYNEVLTGGELSINDHPIFCGSDRITIAFQDIVSTSSTNQQPLGTPVARGFGKNFDTPRIEFTTHEASVFLVLAQAVPEVALANSVPRHLQYKEFGELPNRFFDGTGFQDLRAGDVNFTGIVALDERSVGSQPFFMEAMVKNDIVDGILATSGYKSYTFTRQFNYDYLDDIDVEVDVEYGKYMTTGDYEYIFPAYAPITVQGPSSGPQLDNIFLLADFDFRVYQPLTNQVITTNSI